MRIGARVIEVRVKGKTVRVLKVKWEMSWVNSWWVSVFFLILNKVRSVRRGRRV